MLVDVGVLRGLDPLILIFQLFSSRFFVDLVGVLSLDQSRDFYEGIQEKD